MMNLNYPQNYIEQGVKERLRVKLTIEEKPFFANIFSIADKQKKNKIIGKEAAEFLKRSGLPKETLKTIWIISAQTNPQELERDEFYIALRLIALAQNNMEVCEESIRLDHPHPPLPKFDLKTDSVNSSSNNSNSTQDDGFSIGEEDNKKYHVLFMKNKDLPDKISRSKIHEMLVSAKVSKDAVNKVMSLVPYYDPNALNFPEFKVIFHIVFKYITSGVLPSFLPNSLKAQLADKPSNEINFNFNTQQPIANVQPQISPPIIPTSNNSSNNVIMNVQPMNNNINLNQNSNNVPRGTFNFPQDSISLEPKPIMVQQIQQNDFNKHRLQQPINSYSNNDFQLLKENNINTINNTKNIINDKMNDIYTQSIQDNQFLQKTLEHESNLLTDLLSDFERINKNILSINDKNKQIREQILEVRKSINIERDNLAKALMTLNQKTTELHFNTEELNKVEKEFNEVKLEKEHFNNVQNNNSIHGSKKKIIAEPANNFHSLPSFNEHLQHVPKQYNVNDSLPMFLDQEIPKLETNFNQQEHINKTEFDNLAAKFSSSSSFDVKLANENSDKKLSVFVPSPTANVNYPGLDSVQKHNGKSFNFEGVEPPHNTNANSAFYYDNKVEFDFPKAANSNPDHFTDFPDKMNDDMFKDDGFGNDANWDFR